MFVLIEPVKMLMPDSIKLDTNIFRFYIGSDLYLSNRKNYSLKRKIFLLKYIRRFLSE